MTSAAFKGFSDLYPLRLTAGISRADAARKLKASAGDFRKWEDGATAIPAEAISMLKEIADAKSFPRQSTGGAFTFADLFAGIGGMRQAAQNAGGVCVFTSEWNRDSVETYVSNFGADHPIIGDITVFPETEIPEHDILLAGFPCQPFSRAGISSKNFLGRKSGFADEAQGTLFFDVARILHARRPKSFILENVKNLRTHDSGRTLAVIMDILQNQLGYCVTAEIINSKPWVPQSRDRIYIVGVRDGDAFDFSDIEMPKGEPPILGDILHRSGEPESATCIHAPGGEPLPKYTLTDGLWRWHQQHKDKHQAAGNCFGFGLVGPGDVTRTLSARYNKDGAEILLNQPGRNPRKLTPRECARLMGFDAPSMPRFVIPVSDQKAYRQFGNSVVVPTVTEIARSLVRHLGVSMSLPMAA